MSAHLGERIALQVAGALEPDEATRVEAHLRDCAACAAEAKEWRTLVEGLRGLPGARPTPALVARTRGAVEAAVEERADLVWNRAALGFLIAFAWTLTVAVGLLFRLVGGALQARLEWSVGTTTVWFVVWVLAGWMAAAAAAVLLGRHAGEEGRVV